ncbi:MAG TPA: hypothetical protein DCR87_08390 [Acidobacteria bacterium]|nr:hypothetical protein [Acidobacteriota bacterium]
MANFRLKNQAPKPAGQKRLTPAEFIVSRVSIFRHSGFYLLSVKNFKKISRLKAPAFPSPDLIILAASSAAAQIAGLPLRRFQILPLR